MKFKVMEHLKYKKNCPIVVTEFKNGSDVFGVNRSNYSIEVEVKVDKFDLLSELKTIKYLLDPENDPSYGHYKTRTGGDAYLNKFSKHRSYLFSESKYETRPRYFFFAIPQGLMDLESLEVLKQTPYGLMVVGERDWWNSVLERWPAKPLSKNKFEDFYGIAQKTVNMNLDLMEKIYEKATV